MSQPTKPRKTNGARNRSAGKRWEHDSINMLKERGLYPNCCSTRSESRNLDGAGIDIMNKSEGTNGQMTVTIQCKTESKSVAYPGLLSRIRETGRLHPVIWHRQTTKSGARFMERDLFAICYLSDYLDLLASSHLVSKIKQMILENKPEDGEMPTLWIMDIQKELTRLGL